MFYDSKWLLIFEKVTRFVTRKHIQKYEKNACAGKIVTVYDKKTLI